ncbi:acyl carrier protein [Pantanalinema rosaneae CENA516]|uniref:acyl carrier protein n=1 Tax=Pantanalinema rosaneae TaxID=1620701 RepID=UPI003D6E4841
MKTLKTVLSDLGIPETALHEETYLYGDLGLDSVETVKLALELKRRLGIDLPLGSRHDLSLRDICQQAEALLSAQSP